MGIIKEFENLTQLSKYEKQNKDNLKIDNIDYNNTTEMWIVTFIAKIPINNINEIAIKSEKMDIKNLKKEELLIMREEIDSQLKYIDEIKIEIKKSKEKKSLSDLKKNDKIFCIKFYGSKIYHMDYVEINFYKQNKEDYVGWTNFSTKHNTKPMGCSSCLEDECMYNHFFLSEFSSSNYFFTLKPQSWKEDLKSELIRLITLKEENFNKEIHKFKDSINNLINCESVDTLLNNCI